MARDALRSLLVCSVVFVVSACGAVTPSTPTPTPAPATTTDSFTGALAQSGSTIYPFAVTNTGTVEIGLTNVGPLSTMALGVGIGRWDGTNCTTTIAENTNARSGATALKGTANAGTYCARVFDAGNIPTDVTVTYTIKIAHP